MVNDLERFDQCLLREIIRYLAEVLHSISGTSADPLYSWDSPLGSVAMQPMF
jgi:hypothetical protein